MGRLFQICWSLYVGKCLHLKNKLLRDCDSLGVHKHLTVLNLLAVVKDARN